MRNIKLLIEYDGTGYNGWQIQLSERTLQGTIREVVEKVTDEEVNLQGSSRTDSGVHALGQVASFKTNSRHSPNDFLRSLNALLPKDIVIKDAEEVPEEFDPRRDAVSKTYLYRILNQGLRAPLERERSWHITDPLDIDAMKKGARLFMGEHDFTSFRAAGSDALHSLRDVALFDVGSRSEKKQGLIEIRVAGRSFLRHMVRIMVGTLVKVGRGDLKPEEITRIIEAKDRSAAAQTAPPEGLYLVEVKY